MEALPRIEGIIKPSLEAMGFDLVRVRLAGAPPVLQVMAEKSSARDGITDGGITVEDCAEISRAISAVLDVEDPINGAYTLEVSSPGIDRPLTRAADFERFKGFEAKVELKRPVAVSNASEPRKRFKGKLLGLEGESINFEQDGVPVAFAFDDVHSARLVLTDELIRASLAAADVALAAQGNAASDAANGPSNDNDRRQRKPGRRKKR